MKKETVLVNMFFHLAGLFLLVQSQPGVTFDAAAACWFNLTEDMNSSLTPVQQQQVIEYVNQTVILPVSDLPLGEQATEIEKIIQPAYFYVIQEIAPLQNIGDAHFVTQVFYATSLATYPEAIVYNLENHYSFILPMYEIVMHSCVDGETQPNYRFILRHTVKHMAINILSGSESLDPEATVNATALALVRAYEISSSVGMNFDNIVLDIVGGLTDAYQEIIDTNFNPEELTEMIVGSIVNLDDENDKNNIDIKELVNNTTAILGVDLDTDDVVEAVTSVLGGLIPGLGKK